jgi:hypothetical protein
LIVLKVNVEPVKLISPVDVIDVELLLCKISCGAVICPTPATLLLDKTKSVSALILN